MSIPNPNVWVNKGITFLDQIFSECQLQTFDRLKHQHGLLNSYLFRFLQLRHAFSSQFENHQVAFYTSALEGLLKDEFMVKPLSTIYKESLPSIHTGLETLTTKWLVDFPDLDTEDCEEMLECSYFQLVSTKDRLIQFKIPHIPAKDVSICPSLLLEVFFTHSRFPPHFLAVSSD